MIHRFLPVLVLSGSAAALGAEVSFNRDVRPILSDNCFFCHGTDAKERKGGLRLDTFEGATAEVDGIRAIVPGDPAKSAAWERILSLDPDEVMPPPKSHKKLSAAQKEILSRWIEAGANYEPHWSLVPVRPAPVPAVKQTAWPRGDLDRFLLARLKAEGLSPAKEATKEALIRRVTLDLTGLPPTPAEVEAFLRDTSGTSYETVVDRLLKSPHFGERMAVDWLDAARYADTNGYQVDRDRELWPWRDWVIRAFNENKPFDQFTIEQLAGDLLPGATLDQKVATGFHRNHMLNEEGGVIADEFLAEYTADRVETTAAVWLGQTFNCARCHDHKYDPITQRDFYAMKAFFHNVPERGVGLYSNPVRTNAPPFVRLPAPEVEARIADLTAKSSAVSARIAALASGTASGVDEWAAKLATTSVAWREIELIEAKGGDQPPVLEASRKAVAIGPQETLRSRRDLDQRPLERVQGRRGGRPRIASRRRGLFPRPRRADQGAGQRSPHRHGRGRDERPSRRGGLRAGNAARSGGGGSRGRFRDRHRECGRRLALGGVPVRCGSRDARPRGDPDIGAKGSRETQSRGGETTRGFPIGPATGASPPFR
jgi:hypothetical protein